MNHTVLVVDLACVMVCVAIEDNVNGINNVYTSQGSATTKAPSKTKRVYTSLPPHAGTSGLHTRGKATSTPRPLPPVFVTERGSLRPLTLVKVILHDVVVASR